MVEWGASSRMPFTVGVVEVMFGRASLALVTRSPRSSPIRCALQMVGYVPGITFDQRANWHSDRAYVLSDRVSLLLFVTGAHPALEFRNEMKSLGAATLCFFLRGLCILSGDALVLVVVSSPRVRCLLVCHPYARSVSRRHSSSFW